MTRLPHFMTEKFITKEIEQGKKNPRKCEFGERGTLGTNQPGSREGC